MDNFTKYFNSMLLIGILGMLILIYNKLPNLYSVEELRELRVNDIEKYKIAKSKTKYLGIVDVKNTVNVIGEVEIEGAVEVEGAIDCY